MDKEKKLALECAKQYDFTSVCYQGEWQGHRVYEAGFGKSLSFYGSPRYVLIRDGQARMSEIEEGEKICAALFSEDEEG